ncbi:uncharacterized protein LOC113604776 isoform X1 [Acinonyx jubatus]|uniref:Uncharacterized protein LOC113604776 isoform X1 n=1 Tax=Acinonyx jubatus TaxID=32536 RepID=A0ABM3Q1L0_ACIJB|nr:uncharacterized protein LOC113604776 isoform X1 [Acinonyx jubatus]
MRSMAAASGKTQPLSSLTTLTQLEFKVQVVDVVGEEDDRALTRVGGGQLQEEHLSCTELLFAAPRCGPHSSRPQTRYSSPTPVSRTAAHRLPGLLAVAHGIRRILQGRSPDAYGYRERTNYLGVLLGVLPAGTAPALSLLGATLRRCQHLGLVRGEVEVLEYLRLFSDAPHWLNSIRSQGEGSLLNAAHPLIESSQSLGPWSRWRMDLKGQVEHTQLTRLPGARVLERLADFQAWNWGKETGIGLLEGQYFTFLFITDSSAPAQHLPQQAFWKYCRTNDLVE